MFFFYYKDISTMTIFWRKVNGFLSLACSFSAA